MPLTPKRTLRTFRYAMYFDGVDDYVRTVSTISLSTPITVVVWFSHIDKYNMLTLVANSGAGLSALGFRFFVNTYFSQDRRLVIEVGTGSLGSKLVSSVNAVQPVWNYGVVVVNGGSSLLWLNGQKVVSGSLLDFTKTDYIFIGIMAVAYCFIGYIAQVLVYSRALSDSEILWNYLYPDNPVRNGLVLWLKADPQYIKDIDNDGILEWLDLSGYNNHGKIYGASLVQLIKTHNRTLTPVRVLTPVR
jgi:hypothetical protein